MPWGLLGILLIVCAVMCAVGFYKFVYFLSIGYGFAISIFGLILESIADNQKSAQKKERPDMVATKGLYKMVRCPNYLGEILFRTGIFVSGVTAYVGAGQWIVAILAYICIVYIMFNGAQRLEKRQMARYGENQEYNEYANKTPIIIPLLPIYHLNKKN